MPLLFKCQRFEKIIINDNIAVSVSGYTTKGIFIEVYAPPYIEAHRESIYLRKQAEKQQTRSGGIQPCA